MTKTQTSHIHARCITFAVARIRVKGLPLEIGEILHIFPLAPKVWEIGDPKRLTRVRGQVAYIYLPTKFGCDRSIVVSCRSWNDRHTSRQTDKQNGMTIRLTLCERDATHVYAVVHGRTINAAGRNNRLQRMSTEL